MEENDNLAGWIKELRGLQTERQQQREAAKQAKDAAAAQAKLEEQQAKSLDLQAILVFLGLQVELDQITDGKCMLGGWIFSTTHINWGMAHLEGGKRVIDKSRCEFTLYVSPVKEAKDRLLMAWYDGESPDGNPNQYNSYYAHDPFNARWPVVTIKTDGMHEVTEGWDGMKADLADAFDLLTKHVDELHRQWAADKGEFAQRKLNHEEQTKHQQMVMDAIDHCPEEDEPTAPPETIEARLTNLVRELIDDALEKRGLLY